MDATKYRVGYFPVEKKYQKWVNADHIEKAVYDVLEDGYRCADIMPTGDSDCKRVGCAEMGRLILEKLGGSVS